MGGHRRLDPSTTLRICEGVRTYISSQQLCNERSKVLLAVSGGRDSMVMLSLFHHMGLCPIGVAHCNFGLRGSESDGDEAFVRRECQELGVELFVRRFETEAWARVRGCSIQVAARDLRYSWFEELLEQEGFTCVATAHHAGDLAEGVLLHLARGAGLRGLGGMPVRNGRVIRPLLGTPSEDVAVWAREMGVPFREDSTNASDKYMRNWVRHQALPSLLRVNPQAESNIAHAAHTARLAGTELHRLALELWGEFEGHFHWYAACASGRELLAEWWVGERLSDRGFNFSQVRNVLDALRSNRVGARVATADWVAYVGREGVYVRSCGAGGDRSPRVYPGAHSDRVLRFEYLDAVPSADALRAMGCAREVAHFDADRLRYPLVLRCWQAGDRMEPLGMKGGKKVSDLLTDWRVSPASRSSALVLMSGDEVAWVVGVRQSQGSAVNPSTRRAIRITLQDSAFLPEREVGGDG